MGRAPFGDVTDKERGDLGMLKLFRKVKRGGQRTDDGEREPHRVYAMLAGLRHIVEELNDPSLQRILGADDEEPFTLDQLLENFRSVSQLIRGCANVGPNGLPKQSLRVVPELCSEQRFHRWPNPVDDRAEIPRLVPGCFPARLFAPARR